jgi:hypothetical protein
MVLLNGGDAEKPAIRTRKPLVICYSALIMFCVPIPGVHGSIYAAQEASPWESFRPSAPPLALTAATADRTKVAEGEYEVFEEGNGGAVGPAGEEVYDFHESWTLWRDPKGGFEVEGVRKFESPRDIKHSDRFVVQLSRDMTPERMTEFAKLAWRRDSGPISCDFLAKEIHCTSGSHDPKDPMDLRIPMQFPYGFLWPISPFSLSGLARQSERNLDRPTHVQLLSIEQPNSVNPIYPVVLDGTLQYLGDEDIVVASKTWRAHKFALKVPSRPQFLFWTSAKGLLLSVAFEHPHPNWPKEGMKLSRLEVWTDF